jgi:hypothetical protein
MAVWLIDAYVDSNFELAPAVTHIDMANGAASGGASLSVSGTNFGVADLSLTIRVLLTVCEASVWVSNSGILCKLARGSGVGTLLSVHVTAAGVVGTSVKVFTYDCVFELLVP